MKFQSDIMKEIDHLRKELASKNLENTKLRSQNAVLMNNLQPG